MVQRRPSQGQQHPEEYREDLHPDEGRDENVHPAFSDAPEYRTAHDIKDVHERLQRLNDDDLKRIPIVPAGTRLRQGATYTDLASDERSEFTATAEMKAEEWQRLASKDDVDYELWNTLVGREDRPSRGSA